MSNEIKAKARSFLKQYGLSKVTLADIRRIITAQGYTIVEYNHIYNDGPVADLIEALELDQMVEKSRGFTYADRDRRLVFVHEDLSEQEKLLVLAHEEGHIYCDHMSAAPIIGKDVTQEHEANEFSHYILNPTAAGKVSGFVRKHNRLCASIAILVAVAAVGLLIFATYKKEQSYYGAYYVTSTGDKYHERECIFVKNKTDVRRITVDEFESGNYSRCGICLPPIHTTEEETGNE